MKILILGENGQLGNELHNQAKQLGFLTVGLTREELDITKLQQVNKTLQKEKPDVVINASAYHVVPDCELYPEKAFEINSIAVKNLAEICEKFNMTFVHYSSDFVFDGLKGKLYKESDKPNPLQMYGISKLAGEYAVQTYCKKSIIIRSAYVYGGKTGSRSKKGNFVLMILNQAQGKKELEVSSEQTVSPTYAGDLAKATLQLIQKKNASGIYHLVNEGYCSLADFAKQIVKLRGLKTKIIPVNRSGMAGNLRRPLFSALDNTRAKKLGIILPKWQDGLKKYITELV